MSEEEPTPIRRRFGPVRLIALMLALLVVAALLGVWFERKPIATSYINRYFARAHVPIRYRIGDLSLGRQRLTDVVIGDPAHPDLVADWIEANTRIGVDGVKVLGVRGGRVRLRGRLANGRVSLGSIDRLLPPPSNKPFALPAIDLDVADLGLRLETAAGLIGIKLTGKGRLDGGFVGEAAAVAPALAARGCAAEGVQAALHVEVHRVRPTLSGPVRIARLDCGAVKAEDAKGDIDTTLGAALDSWQGRATLALGSADAPAGNLRALRGRVTFAGTAAATGGVADLASGPFRTRQVGGRSLRLAGRYRIGNGAAFAGRIGAGGVSLAPEMLGRANRLSAATAGTPIGPIAAAWSRALVAAGRAFDVDGNVRIDAARAVVSDAALSSSSGGRMTLSSVNGVAYDWSAHSGGIDGALTVGGGGLPSARIVMRQDSRGMAGIAMIAPYAAGGASLMLAPVRFVGEGGNTRFTTIAELSGPLGNGRLEGARFALDGRIDRNGAVAINPGCSEAGFERLAISGLDLRPARLRLCPIGPALVRFANGGIAGGARIAAPRLTGRIGATPLSIAAAGAEVRLGDRGFALTDIAARLGAPDRATRLDVGVLEGKISNGVVGGRFARAGGQIGNVPLFLSDAAGEWSLAGGRLALRGGLTVADAAAQARFNPLAGRNVSLDLAGGRIAATGKLVTPKEGVKVADVSIVHDLGRGAGDADMRVPGITFAKGFQPDVLTRLTYGVIADVKGTVSGAGHIAWSPQGVASTGTFGTAGIDLAAAFGPVSGLKTELHFTDLLGMTTAPGQIATIAGVNPGVAVENGTIRYQLLSPTEVQVEGGHWPFAGGDLTLEPTLLDFGEAKVRRMTFRVAGMDAAQFLQQFDFKNMNATGTFDGVLPMTFDADGGRIVNGHLTVREGGGSIAYVGDLTEKDLGFWGNVAFQALKSLRYRNLNIVMNGPLSGEMVTEVRFAGISQGEGAKSNFLIRRLTKLPFVFNVTIRAPFRGLIDTAQSFYDPKRLIERNLPALLQQQQKQQAPPVQPPASEKMP